jgi:peptide/nickel transport system ATP-binding protein
MTSTSEIALDVRDLTIHYETPEGDVKAACGVCFKVNRGELLGLVGESGCGKTTVAMGLLRLVQPPGRIVQGQAILNGETDLLALSGRDLRASRWTRISLVPQGAMNSLNPTMRIKEQIADAIRAHDGHQDPRRLKARILDLFSLVGLPSRVYSMYPHELSGGMKQRVCIAMAISLHPSVVIADEPTSALDVIVQRVVAQTLTDIKNRLGMAVIMIGHDMALMAQMADRIAVMYAGRMMELGSSDAILKQPRHPYTQLLIESIPSIKERKPLKLTEGLTHDLRNPPPGCIFQFRCPQVAEICRSVLPTSTELEPGHTVACHLYPNKETAHVNPQA